MKKWLSLEAPGTRSARAGLYGFTSGDAADSASSAADAVSADGRFRGLFAKFEASV
jgi:hypothetical protein